jgi:hypothetical protein
MSNLSTDNMPFAIPTSVQDWEILWASYSEEIYRSVLAEIKPTDIILDIGAGDLRLSRRMGDIARQVVAIEIQRPILDDGLAIGPLSSNISVIHGDALTYPFPRETTLAVLLMRHCTHFSAYLGLLQKTNCRKLVTNARWRMDVEIINLKHEPWDFKSIPLGWYACRCGQVGFKPGPPEKFPDDRLERTWEVANCNSCDPKIG